MSSFIAFHVARAAGHAVDVSTHRFTHAARGGLLWLVALAGVSELGNAQSRPATGSIERSDNANGGGYRTETASVRGVSLTSMSGDPYDPYAYPTGTATATVEITAWEGKGYEDGRTCKGGAGSITRTVKGSMFFNMGDGDWLWGLLTVPSALPNPAIPEGSLPFGIGGVLRLELRNVRFAWNCPLYQVSETRDVTIEVLNLRTEITTSKSRYAVSPEGVATGTTTENRIDRCSDVACQTIPFSTTWSWKLALPRPR